MLLPAITRALSFGSSGGGGTEPARWPVEVGRAPVDGPLLVGRDLLEHLLVDLARDAVLMYSWNFSIRFTFGMLLPCPFVFSAQPSQSDTSIYYLFHQVLCSTTLEIFSSVPDGGWGGMGGRDLPRE